MPATTNTAVTIRTLGPADEAAVRLLAELDSAPVPDGELLGAEVEGRLLAARSLSGTAAIADPFSRTREIASLLDLRARQLRRRPSRRAAPAARRSARLAGSPPGRGGRGGLLTPLRPY